MPGFAKEREVAIPAERVFAIRPLVVMRPVPVRATRPEYAAVSAEVVQPRGALLIPPAEEMRRCPEVVANLLHARGLGVVRTVVLAPEAQPFPFVTQPIYHRCLVVVEAPEIPPEMLEVVRKALVRQPCLAPEAALFNSLRDEPPAFGSLFSLVGLGLQPDVVCGPVKELTLAELHRLGRQANSRGSQQHSCDMQTHIPPYSASAASLMSLSWTAIT
ncbi:hypothetical protein CH330_05610 [candidate division WOR-3 bacterium JGI_Cruoil_03_51_56]|uniref:Uncharacterized protein n=1 Tax=candidate division WOR-3 bacterium JGI_Cruoil_03_51_56 TaxID=1973747 RepID=A0A235BTW3_UNCW3|nr:MAG: hypothetical protein CH330_05610 [candidate division WOR-3 bacterium JGI_Cruoil_03_51_56]